METITTYGVGPAQPTYAQLREQNRVLREALEEFCKETEYVASRMAYQCGLGAGEWEAFIDQANYYKQYKQGKAALTATSQPTAAEVHQRMFDHGDATSQEGQG